MRNYLVLIHGKEVLASFGGEVRPLGFYKSVKVRAAHTDDLLSKSIEVMKRDPIFISAIVNPDELSTKCEIEEYSLWRFRIRHPILKDATFYDESN